MPTKRRSARRTHWLGPLFAALLLLDLWAAHAIAFFAHEYAHSIVAWLLGCKPDPLALHYPPLSAAVLLIQRGIDQNVDLVPVFATGLDLLAGIIAAAGSVLGNALLTLPLSRLIYAIAHRRGHRGWAMFAYWLTVASIGNLIDYVPIRTFTNRTDLYQDMYAVERGFHCSPWTLLILLGPPTLLILLYFFLRIEPATLRWLFPRSAPRRAILAVLTALALFAFYGAAGWSGAGPISHRLSFISVCILTPIAAILSAVLAARSSNRA